MAAGTGIDANTGQVISGWAHVVQSIGIILRTSKMSRVMRRDFGCGVARRVDRPVNQITVVDFYADIAQAIRAYEPRYRVVKMSVDGTVTGQLSVAIEGVFYPRGHLGDFSVSIPQSASLSL